MLGYKNTCPCRCNSQDKEKILKKSATLGKIHILISSLAELKGAVGQIIHVDKTVLAVEQNKVLVPQNYSKYLAWGFSDLSVRIGNYDSDRATAVFESLDNGEILCAACPNPKCLITAGTSTVSPLKCLSMYMYF